MNSRPMYLLQVRGYGSTYSMIRRISMVLRSHFGLGISYSSKIGCLDVQKLEKNLKST